MDLADRKAHVGYIEDTPPPKSPDDVADSAARPDDQAVADLKAQKAGVKARLQRRDVENCKQRAELMQQVADRFGVATDDGHPKCDPLILDPGPLRYLTEDDQIRTELITCMLPLPCPRTQLAAHVHPPAGCTGTRLLHA